MKNWPTIFLIILTFILFSGCNLTSTGEINIKAGHVTPTPSPAPTNLSATYNVTPASGRAQGTHSAAEVSIGPKSQVLHGSSISGNFSIYSDR